MVYSFLIFQKIRIIMNEIYDTSRLPPNILTYSNDNFYDFVQEFLGDVESDIVKIQCLKNARLLLHTPNVFSLFDLDCADLLELKKRACFILKNNSYVVRPGIIYNIEYLINIFKYRMNQQVNNNINHLDKYTTSTIHQALTALTNNVPKTMSKEPFLHLFLQNILNNYGRWLFIYNRLKLNNINVVGFSMDCDVKYLKSVRLSTDFFAKLPNIDLLNDNNDLFSIDIPSSWTWVFMRNRQLFFCMQDGIHLDTKLRNRILSKHSTMLMSNYSVDVEHIRHLIKNNSKLEHNAVKSDRYPRDRQNFHII
ncbi:unnamed protein product [Didymodactylos carnosus]|uniref:Uncharacterized protein n=1 Tax=Didymodactylos carnosus TaxID=1234261 RepID=A0A8S2UTA3_9BILA|nr:unnamed protein product [Didymodactylos carnosus]